MGDAGGGRLWWPQAGKVVGSGWQNTAPGDVGASNGSQEARFDG